MNVAQSTTLDHLKSSGFFPEDASVFSYFLSRLTMEALITFLQITLQVSQAAFYMMMMMMMMIKFSILISYPKSWVVITFFMIGFQANFIIFLRIVYILAMSSTALAVLLGCLVEDTKLAQEMLPIIPQMLVAGGHAKSLPYRVSLGSVYMHID
jgi:hypothetical protein